MAVKYAVLLGDRCLPGVQAVFPRAHIPVDSVMLSQLARYGLPKPRRFSPWSRIDSYPLYFDLQQWVRQCFQGSTPLAVEFHLWQERLSGQTLIT